MPDGAPHDPTTPAPAMPVSALVTVFGVVRGAELAGRARVDADASRVTIAPERGAPLHVPLARIDGVRRGARDAGAHLTLYLDGGDVVELAATPADAAALDAMAERVVAAGLAFPELTRGLRALGSARGMPGSDHDRFFAPFVEALAATRRLAASRAPTDATPVAIASAAGAAAMAASLRAALRAFAVARFPERAPDQRALEAELLELAEPTLASLDALDEAARALFAAEPASRFASWRAWTSALARVLAAADRCWLDALPVLADSRGAQGRAWRRVVGRDEGTAR